VNKADVVVVGGGPAGAAAAALLARAGRDTLVVDRALFPRDKCCGDGLTTAALRLLEALGLNPATIPSWQAVDGCWVRSPSGRTVCFPFPSAGAASVGVYGAVARRAELDAAVLELAAGAGARVVTGEAVTGVKVGDDSVRLDLGGDGDGLGAVSSRYVVAADGVWSAVRRALVPSPGAYLGDWHAYRQYFCTAEPLARRMWVWFEPEVLPGYAWSFPLAGDVVNVGFGIRRVGRANSIPTRAMAGLWRGLMARPYIAEVLGRSAVAVEAPRSWPIPARLSATVLAAGDGRALFAGDAARAADPMTGEGIAQALETGCLAADAINAAGPRRADVAASRYSQTVHRAMVLDQRLAGALSSCLRSPAVARGAVRGAAISGWTRRNFARWLFEDYPRAVLCTPARWHRGMLAGLGAFAELGRRPA